MKAQDLLDELSGLVRIPLRLSPDEMRDLVEGGSESEDAVREQVENTLLNIALTRVIGALQRRVGFRPAPG